MRKYTKKRLDEKLNRRRMRKKRKKIWGNKKRKQGKQDCWYEMKIEEELSWIVVSVFQTQVFKKKNENEEIWKYTTRKISISVK